MTNYQFSPLINPVLHNDQDHTARFSSADWFAKVRNQDVTIAGVGGIGSWLAFMIARLSVNTIRLIDDDLVDRTNMAGQMFCNTDVGQHKVEAVRRLINTYSASYNVYTYTERVSSNSNLTPVVMCGFDNMLARKAAFIAWKQGLANAVRAGIDPKNYLFIDGRLSAETLQVFCFTGEDEYYMTQYEEKWLFSDEEAESTVCSYKQTSYCANLIASLMTNLFVNWCTNKCNPLVDRALPFMLEYGAEQMYLKVEV